MSHIKCHGKGCAQIHLFQFCASFLDKYISRTRNVNGVQFSALLLQNDTGLGPDFPNSLTNKYNYFALTMAKPY